MDLCAAQFFCRHCLVGDGFDDIRTGDKHIGPIPHHEDKIGHGRRIHIATGARAKDHRELRNDARGDHVSLEDFAVTP